MYIILYMQFPTHAKMQNLLNILKPMQNAMPILKHPNAMQFNPKLV